MKSPLFYMAVIMMFVVYPAHVKGQKIKLASINVRYDTKADGLNQWANRKQQMCEFISAQELDIFCLQEVLPRQLTDIKAAFPQYAYIYPPRDGKNSESIPVFYLTEKYECIEEGTFWLSETPDSAKSIGWDGAHPRIAVWLKLKDKKTDRCFYIVNTHLDHKGKKARRMGMRLIKNRFSEKQSESPIIITGDMNCSAESSAISIAQTEVFPMYDSFQIAKKRNGVPYTFHAFGKRAQKRIRMDFIFVTQQIEVQEMDIPQERSQEGVYLSDHCPVVATLEIYQ